MAMNLSTHSLMGMWTVAISIFLANVDSAAVICLSTVFSSFGYIPRSGIAGSHSNLVS